MTRNWGKVDCTAEEETPIEIMDCGVQPHGVGDLTNSEASVQEGKRNCNFCDYVCYQLREMKSHKRSVHGGERQFKCSSCDYVTFLKANLVSHLFVHSKGKPYKCNTCDYRSKSLFILHRHKRDHSKEKLHKCNICGAAHARGALQMLTLWFHI